MFFINFKIKKELKAFKEFKKNYKFDFKKLTEKDGLQYCDGVPLVDENGKEIGFCDKWVNVGYKLHGPFSKCLSNLFNYEFYFKNKKVNSIESVFQGIKLKNKKSQNKAFKYWGMDSNTIKVASDFDWNSSQTVYWQGKPIQRLSQQYDDFLDELYVSAIQNPLYRNALKNVPFPYILHSMGTEKKEDTVFTRYEFEFMLNCLSSYVKQK
ncbi:MAG: hypothetical protein IJD48_03420 [Clostridia bacterium]|nr:hypothetical protein [Clostridia bacterium]